MRMSDAYPSQWLAADDLNEADMVVTIRDEEPAEWQEFKQLGKATPDRKPVLYFKAPKGIKPLILNKTNYKTISEVLGTDETEEWGGQSITLYPTEVESFGEMKLSIRVRTRRPRVVNNMKSAARVQPQNDNDDSQNSVNLP